MYESPIQMAISDVVNEVYKKQEEYVMQCVRNIGIDIDKEELLKALQYDRNQYSKGYADGKAEMREKIDKAIEEIEQECVNDMTFDKVAKLHCIDVILRHIGDKT